jgi:hypothetical protein
LHVFENDSSKSALKIRSDTNNSSKSALKIRTTTHDITGRAGTISPLSQCPLPPPHRHHWHPLRLQRLHQPTEAGLKRTPASNSPALKLRHGQLPALQLIQTEFCRTLSTFANNSFKSAAKSALLHSKYLVVILLPVHVREKTQTKLVFPRGSQAKTSWAVTCPTDTWAHVGRYRCDGVDEDLAAGEKKWGVDRIKKKITRGKHGGGVFWRVWQGVSRHHPHHVAGV